MASQAPGLMLGARTTQQSVHLGTIAVPTVDGELQIAIASGQSFMVAGPNGVGKSALLYMMYRAIGAGRAEYYPGHRQITFNQGWDTLGQDIDQLKTNLYTHIEVFNRYKNHWSEDMFKSVVKRLTRADAAYNSRIVAAITRSPEEAKRIKEEFPGPVDVLNRVFSTARLPISFVLSAGGLRARRAGMEYDIDQLSDGERAALLITGAAIVQDPYTILAIDEPERNLHPSISSALVNAVVRARPDIGFIFASHDMNLISGVSVDSLIYVQDSQLISSKPEMRVFSVKLLENMDAIGEDLRRDLLGSRQDIMFIEGEYTSIDFQIYNSLFPDWKVIPKGGAEKVSESVKALADNPALHWFRVTGLIDRDGRSEQEVEKLAAANVNALLCPTSENLLFLPEVVKVVGEVLFEAEGGLDSDARVAAVSAAVPGAVAAGREDIIARTATWRTNRMLAEQKVSVASMKAGTASVAPIDVAQIVAQVEQELTVSNGLVSDLAVVQSLPVKNTRVPSALAAAAGCDYQRYKKIVFNQLDVGGEKGMRLRAAMMSKIPQLTSSGASASD